MNCLELKFSGHSLMKMFARSIAVDEIKYAIRNGEIIMTYPDDKPFPSFLLFSIVNNRPVHVVVAQEISTEICIIVTAYIPDSNQWSVDFKLKLKR